MKTKLRLLILLVFVGFNTIYSQFSAIRPDLRLCGSPPNYYLDYYNCTSNNYTLVDVFLSLTDVNGVPLNNTTCTIGTPQDLYVMLDYTSNSASAVHHARMFADLNIEGQGTVPLNVDFRTVQPGAGQIALYGPFTWVCGQEITLSRILIVWRTNGDDTELVPYDCSTYNKSQCDLPDNIAVTAPLAVEFDYTACTVGNLTTVNFNSTTSGGTPPYTYAWDFDNNGTTDSILENPTFVYNNSMSYSAELTVTDNLGLSNSYLVPIVYPTEIQITSSLTTVGCSTSNDGAIDITVSGGTLPYSYLWNNGVITQDISNLLPGNYNVQVTDSFGCIKNEFFTILNGDTTPPVVTITPDVTLEGCSTAIIDVTDLPYSSIASTIDLATFQSVGGTITDASSISSISYQDTQTGTCPIIVTRTYTVLDACNNSTSISKTFTIDDTIPPTFVESLPANVTVECNAVPTAVTLTATDICGTPTVTYVEVRTNGTCTYDYTLTRTWTATDTCGNTTTHNQVITVQDNSNPTFVESLPANATVECNAVPTAVTLTAMDLCGTATVTYAEVRTNGTCTYDYTLTRTWTATDACGNITSHNQVITVQDNSNPTFVESLPANVTVECNAVPTAITLTATDVCGTATVTYAEVRTNGTCTYDYTLTRTWTATDACGNTTSHNQVITVQDNSNPTFVESLPANVNVECNAVPAAATLTATDICGTATVTYTEVRTNGTCTYDYTLTRTWTATDACGNTTTHIQVITVQDNSNPTFVESLPTNVTVECNAVPTATTLTATDICGTATVTYNEVRTNGTCTYEYTLTRTWTATDECGNTTIHNQVITVQDNSNPTFVESLPADEIIECNATVPNAATLTATDVCGNLNVTFTQQEINGSCDNERQIIRTWTATDACGNVTTHIQTITIQDTTPPVFTGIIPSPVVYAYCDGIPAVASITASDNCGATTISFNEVRIDGDCINKYDLNRTWTAEDDCGNIATFTQVVHVACDIKIYNAVSPNNDGMNDIFYIEGIDCYPNNSVEIYNRWGIKVFTIKGYDNVNKVFNGYSNEHNSVSGNDLLPAGTYFYILKYEYDLYGTEKQNIEKSGYLYIQSK